MASKSGISGLAVFVAAVGGYLVYAGIRDVPLIDGLRELISGKTPVGQPQKGTAQFLGRSTGTAAGSLASGLTDPYKLGPRVDPFVKRIAAEIGPEFGIKTIGGWRLDVLPEHPSGRALDWMINNIPNGTAVGQRLADHLVANQVRLGIINVIWNRRIFTSARAREGWRPYNGRSAHTDHVHSWHKAGG